MTENFDEPGISRHIAATLIAVSFVLMPLLATSLSTETASAVPLPLKLYVEDERVDYFIMDDGSAQVTYLLTIYVLADSPALTRLFLKMPNYDFEASDVSAVKEAAGGDRPVDDVHKSSTSETTVVIELGEENQIQGGTNGTIIIKAVVDKAVFKSDKKSSWAMVEYSPMWWDEDTTPEVWAFTFRFHLPKGLASSDDTEAPGHTAVWWEPKENRTIYEWSYTNPRLDLDPRFECHFPRSAVGHVYDRFWDLEFPRFVPLIIAVTVMACAVFGIVAYLKTRRRPYERPMLTIEMRSTDPDVGPMDMALLQGAPDHLVAKMAVADLVDRGILVVDVTSPLRVRVLNPPTGVSMADVPSAPLLKCLADGAFVESHSREVIDTMRQRAIARMRGFDMSETLQHGCDRSELAWARLKGRRITDHDDGLWMMLTVDAAARSKKDVDTAEGGFPDWTGWRLGWKKEDGGGDGDRDGKGKKKNNQKKKENRKGTGGDAR